MRHSNSGRKLSRTPSHRKALMRNLAKALITHGRITTTEMKAKELRRVVEPLVTLAKADTLAARRKAYRVLNDLKLAMPRKGDNAPMAVIEFVKKQAAAKAEAPVQAAAEAPKAEEAKAEESK